MTCDQLLDSFCKRSKSASDRICKAVESLDEAALNRQPAQGTWSPAQILDHLYIANSSYIPLMQEAIAGGQKGSEDVRHSMIGRFIIKALRGTSAPAPKQLTPGSGPFGKDVVARWLGQQRAIESLAQNGKGRDRLGFAGDFAGNRGWRR